MFNLTKVIKTTEIKYTEKNDFVNPEYILTQPVYIMRNFNCFMNLVNFVDVK